MRDAVYAVHSCSRVGGALWGDTRLNSLHPQTSALVAHQQFGDEVVVLHLDRQEMLGLNATGAFIWGLLDGGKSPGDLAAAMAEQFRIPLKQAERDVRDFLDDMTKRGCVSWISHEQNAP